ncbi:N-formylglutamate amidohydrolase [Glacieibacterium frigidum]|uniref:N-formylglutamate amidohydrolase n=1 Tax=Glacieibacterium frigidum TaxID=2593303 RepID=UPI001A9C3CD4|nr:N-formylglutamate amidohydrolase [Glacieibacterium frigidum]
MTARPRLLGADDLPPVEIVNPDGSSRLLLIGDHAGNLVPSALGTLGVAAHDLARHIGWDIGVDALGRSLAARLDAVFVRQRYSRLVIDCNRDPAAAAAIPAESDGTAIPGNVGLDPAARRVRVAEIHEPYQFAVGSALAGRPASDVLVSLHSFTPVLAGRARPWHLGVLHAGHNDAFARRLLDWLTRYTELTIGDNEPYRMDATDHTVPRHAFDTDRPYVELEIRQDLLEGAANVEIVASLLTAALAATVS